MKRYMWLYGMLILLLLLGGCKENEEEESKRLPVSEEQFYYVGTEETDCFTVDENGLLYTMTYVVPDQTELAKASEGVDYNSAQIISVYDLDGTCLEQIKLTFGNGMARRVIVKEGILYCVLGESMQNSQKKILFAVDTTTWEIQKKVEVTGFEQVYDLVVLGDYFYLLGIYRETDVVSEETMDNKAFSLRNNKVCRINFDVENPKVELMNLEYPEVIYATSQDTLVIYRYTEENGYGFLEFNPMTGTLEEVGWKTTDAEFWDMGGCGDGFVCSQLETFTKGYLMYGTPTGEETQLSSENIKLSRPACYRDGFLFFMNSFGKGGVERICIANILQKNQTLRLLTLEDAKDRPYGCGYMMEKQVAEAEEFVLKILARDKDFDLFFLSSRQPFSDNIRKNGAFYALNEVEGVREYLDACFPYLKEAATNEDGDIWMVPVAISIPCLLYNKEFCEENGIDFQKMNFEKYLEFTRQVKENEEESFVDISTFTLVEQLFGQYLLANESFDTELLRQYAKQMRSIYEIRGPWGFNFLTEHALEEGNIPDFYYTYQLYSSDLENIGNVLGASDKVGITGFPRVDGHEGNVGNIVFMAVNPASDNLESTLEYISAFSKYMLTKKDSFLLADASMYTDTPFVRDWYELSANGAVFFQIDKNVYWNTYYEYLEGKIGLEEAIAEMERMRKLYLEE